MKHLVFISVFIILTFIALIKVCAQTNFEVLEETNPYNSELEIVNGEKWNYYNNYKGHPFWNKDIVYNGKVNYRGQIFQDLKLKFDLVNQELILFKKVGSQTKVLKLNKKFIETFRLEQTNNESPGFFVLRQLNEDMEKQFYQQVYTGKSECYIFHNKTVSTKISGNYMGKYLYKPVIYVQKDRNFIPCTNNQTFLNIFREQKKVLRKYMRKNHLDIDAKKPHEIAQILKYHDNLNP